MHSDVIVIGAGAAGLVAARHLARRSFRVVLLEARDRAGGRAWSRPFGRTAVPVELGAEFIHGRAELTHALLREAGLAAVDTCGESWSRRNGTFYRDDGEFMSAVRIFARTQELREDESVDQFLARFAENPAMHETVNSARAFVEGFDAADPAIASAQSIFEEFSAGLDTASARPMGGYQALFDYLRDACIAQGVEAHLSAIVRRITWKRGSVMVDATMAEGEKRRFEAGCAVVTLPVGVLRHGARDGTDVAFEPALPPDKHHALHDIEMGHVIRLALRFRTPFWEKLEDGRYRDGGFFRGTEGPFGVVWTQVPIRSEHLVAWCGGPKADALKDASEDELTGLTLDKVGSMFGDHDLVRAQFEAATMHDWMRDPFARGAYSYLRTGGMGARAALAAPIHKTLFFAGEATSTNGESGTVNGALETGERAAQEVVAALK